MNTESNPFPASLLVSLETIVEPLDPGKLFLRAQPLQVELGCGDGSFLAQYAALHPEWNFIAVERLLGRLRKIDRKGQRAGLANVRGIRIEAAYFLEYLLPKKSVTALHVYFPDPWPKRKHHKHRLINKRFPELAQAALAPGGTVYLRTDDADYFAQMKAIFEACPPFAQIPTPQSLSEVLTDFERDFLARGIQTLRSAWQLAGA
ncbi:MAG: tRNA (guanosine(46)-N7)-methyltransferase TrmB [Limisphaerales bacterium]